MLKNRFGLKMIFLTIPYKNKVKVFVTFDLQLIHPFKQQPKQAEV